MLIIMRIIKSNYTKAIKLPNKPLMTIEELKNIIVERLTLDIFITLQNGVLIELFADEEAQTNIDDYKKSQLYKTLTKELKNEASKYYFKRIISAYENFIKYIKDPTIIINYEYLWDFITTPMSGDGGGLFTHGINLIILRSPADDITDKIELICPTNHYASNAYDINKMILILYNRGNYYEPIYKYTREQKNTYLIRKLFYLPDMKKIMPEIERIMSFIWKNLVTKCQPLPSMPEKYNNDLNFKENVSASDIIGEISKGTLGYKVKSQVINFETKVIGILAINKKEHIYIPCRPSSILMDIPYTYIHDPNMWGEYDSTRDQLMLIMSGTKGKIPCKPTIKIVDNNIIIGIITETNQMVPTLPKPYQVPLERGQEVDGLKTIHLNSNGDGENFLQIDENTLMNTTIDEDRIIKVKQIQLESNFYNIFRNLLRIVLANYEHKREKELLLELIESPVKLYQDKLVQIKTTLHTLLHDRIEFSQLDIASLKDIRSVTQCLGLDKNPCEKESVCTFSVAENKCVLQLPKKNLINGTDNEVTYYGRLSDELIRYPRIQTYIFKPKTFLSFQEVNYQLRDNEIILLEEILYGDYFVDLVAIHPNPFIQSKGVYDLVEPQGAVPYKTKYNLDVLLDPVDINPCIIGAGVRSKLSLGHWKDGKLIRTKEVVKNPDGKIRIILRSHREASLLEGYNLQEFKHTFNCSWEIFAAILSNFKGASITTNSIRENLIRKYSLLFSEGRKEQVLSILKNEGKKDQVSALESGTSIVDIITMSNYYLSLLDIFILSKIYKLPCAVLCRTNIPTLQSKIACFIQSNHKFVYLIFSGMYPYVNSNTPPAYGLLSKNDAIRIPNAFLSFYDTLIKDNITTIDKFIERVKQGEQKHKQNLIKKRKKHKAQG